MKARALVQQDMPRGGRGKGGNGCIMASVWCHNSDNPCEEGRGGEGRGNDQGTDTTNLLIDRVAFSKNEVTAKQTREKGIMRPLLAAVELPLKQQQRLVDRDEAREIRCVLLGRAEYGFETCLPAGGR
jgi:hypothetical protein